jgi:hypothetical protein
MFLPKLLLVALAAPDPTAAATLLPAEKRWAAVAGCARLTDGNVRGLLASAVCVGYRDGHAYLLTASHAAPRGSPLVFEFFARDTYPDPVGRPVVGGEVVVRLEPPDVALVKVPLAEAPAVLPLAGPGRRPKRFPFDAVSVGCPDGLPPVCRAERVGAKKLVRRPGEAVAFFWEAAERPVQGMSGGPLLDKDGRVIGLCGAAQGGNAYFTHADEILAGLKTEGYGWLFDGGK